MARGAFVLFVVALLAPGCYLDHERRDPDEPEEPGEPAPGGAIELLLARAWCESMAECVSESRAPLVTRDEPLSRIDIDRCVEHGAIRDRVRRVAAPWDEALARGEGRLDPAAVEGCMATIRDTTCGWAIYGSTGFSLGFGGWPPFGVGLPGVLGYDDRCDAMYVRPAGRAVGDACDGPLDCEPGSFCGHPRSGDRCVRQCIAYDQEGDPCAEGFLTQPCRAPHLRCSRGACISSPLTREAGEGEPCGSAGTRDERCGPGLACVFSWEEGLRRCVRPDREAGERCSVLSGPWCAPPLLCLEDELGSEPTCGALELTSEVGARCSGETDARRPTAVCDPRAGLACVPNRFGWECAPRSSGTEGARCDRNREPCTPPLSCVDRVCVALVEGSPCGAGDECIDGFCDHERDVCVRCR